VRAPRPRARLRVGVAGAFSLRAPDCEAAAPARAPVCGGSARPVCSALCFDPAPVTRSVMFTSRFTQQERSPRTAWTSWALPLSRSRRPPLPSPPRRRLRRAAAQRARALPPRSGRSQPCTPPPISSRRRGAPPRRRSVPPYHPECPLKLSCFRASSPHCLPSPPRLPGSHVLPTSRPCSAPIHVHESLYTTAPIDVHESLYTTAAVSLLAPSPPLCCFFPASVSFLARPAPGGARRGLTLACGAERAVPGVLPLADADRW
jgi:hypothetical protein